MHRRSSTGKTATALALALLAGNGCRAGGRRAAGDDRLADVVETSPETAERLKATGAAMDTLLAARPAEREHLVRSTERARQARDRGPDAYAGDPLAAELAAAANVEVAFLRGGIIQGLSSYRAFAWARALAADTGPEPESWAEPRTFALRWETGYLGRYAVSFRHLPVDGGPPLVVAIAIAE